MNGMKKIKINVLTKEQKEERLRAKAEKAAAGNVSLFKSESPLVEQPLSPPPVTEPQSDPIYSGTVSPEDPVTQTEIELRPQHLYYNTPTEPIFGAEIPLPPSGTTTAEPSPSLTTFPLSSLVQPPPESTQDIDLFVPYQPDGPPANIIPIHGPVQILEPNTGTPARPNFMQPPRFQSASVPVSPVRRGGHGFTATSSIPFSPQPAQGNRFLPKDSAHVLAQPTMKTDDIDPNTWEIPETPVRRQ
jgi:histone deacetylase HOS3